MIVVNRKGLSQGEFEKVIRPYAKNSGNPVNFASAGEAAVSFLKEHPTLLEEAGKLLDKAQQ